MEILARAVGRRKEAVAQVQMVRGTGQFIINTKSAQEYLQNDSCSILEVQAPFEMLQKSNLNHGGMDTMDTIVKVKGGGLKGQAEAIRLGISRAICLLDNQQKHTTTNLQENISTNQENTNSEYGAAAAVSTGKATNNSAVRKQLKDKGYLTQDSRVKERRKYGLKKARKASQYHKR